MKSFFIFYVTLLFFLCGCSSTETDQITIFSGTEMTINYRILIGHSLSSMEKNVISQIIKDTFDEVNQIYNKWNPYSELSKVNQLKAHTPLKISFELEECLRLTDHIVKLTEGRFDPTIEPLETLWKKYLELGTVPPDKEIQSIAQLVGWNKIHFDNGLFYKDEEDIKLDLGGIAKGYCVDLIVTRLNRKGYDNVFVEWGGEIRASGEHPSKRPWTIYISGLNNTHPDDALAIIQLHNQAIATSGDYLQNWFVEQEGDEFGKTYFHIIDPVQKQPLESSLESIASTSVLASTCAFADGLATAAMMFPNSEKAYEWAHQLTQQYPELCFWIISRQDLD